MALSREEIASELVWRYVEHLRGPDAEPLSDAELEQLVGVLKSADPVGEALDAESEAARHAVVRKRLEELLSHASRPAAGVEPTPSARPSCLPALVPAWRFRVACGLAAALALALASVGVWHHPPTKVRVQKLVIPRDINGVGAMDERQAHELMPKMVHNQLSPQQEKDLMGHMLVCPGCFREYVQLKQHVRDMAHRDTHITVASRH